MIDLSQLKCTDSSGEVPCSQAVSRLVLPLAGCILAGYLVSRKTKDIGYGIVTASVMAMAFGINVHIPPPTEAPK